MKAGTRIGGKYRLVRPLGEGGMGVVWSAINELTEREVALKLIRGQDTTEDSRMRLLREARACGRINHRNVVEIYDVGQTDSGDPFLVMQMLAGETVGEKLAREKKINPEEALRIAAETARGLRAAHAARVLHRDMKPSNLFLHEEPGADGPVLKILDFGVSKTLQQDSNYTATGKTMGSPAYMSPEQVRGLKTVDYRTDLWSLGTVLAEMISGRRVFQGLTPYGAAAEVLSGRIRSLADMAPDTDPRIVAIVDRCLQRDVDKRFASADELLEAIMPLLGDERGGLLGPPHSRRSVPPSAAQPQQPPAPMVAPKAPPLPVIIETDEASAEFTPTDFVEPPEHVDDASAAYAVPLDMRDTVRPKPQSMPPAGASGLPMLESIPPEEGDLTRADSHPAGLLPQADDEEPPSSPKVGGVVLWDEYVRRKAVDGPASVRASMAPPAPDAEPADANPDASAAKRRRMFLVVGVLATAAIFGAAVALLIR